MEADRRAVCFAKVAISSHNDASDLKGTSVMFFLREVSVSNGMRKRLILDSHLHFVQA